MWGCENAPELRKLLKAAIEDERKAQGEYKELAGKAKETLEEHGPSDNVARAAIESVATDEAKHEKMLTELLKIVDDVCPSK